MGIESVVDEKNGDKSSGVHDAGCSACEMAVVWMQSQLRQNQTKERILEYVNEVSFLPNFFIYFLVFNPLILHKGASTLTLTFDTISAL